MLLQERIKTEGIRYPVLQTRIDAPLEWGKSFLLLAGCFHDFLWEDDEHLAGMGLAIIGNTVKLMNEAERQQPRRRLLPSLWFLRALGEDPQAAPWPGMPSDNPTLPLNPDELPFEAAMFLTDEKEFKRRVDRLALMHRIESVWVPWLKRMAWRLA